jgi:hypothetical protein
MEKNDWRGLAVVFVTAHDEIKNHSPFWKVKARRAKKRTPI